MLKTDELPCDWHTNACAQLVPRQGQVVIFSARVNERAASLGNVPWAIKDRIRGDIAVARAQLGDSELLHWN